MRARGAGPSSPCSLPSSLYCSSPRGRTAPSPRASLPAAATPSSPSLPSSARPQMSPPSPPRQSYSSLCCSSRAAAPSTALRCGCGSSGRLLHVAARPRRSMAANCASSAMWAALRRCLLFFPLLMRSEFLLLLSVPQRCVALLRPASKSPCPTHTRNILRPPRCQTQSQMSRSVRPPHVMMCTQSATSTPISPISGARREGLAEDSVIPHARAAKHFAANFVCP